MNGSRRGRARWAHLVVALAVAALVSAVGAGAAFAGELSPQGVSSTQLSIDCSPNGPESHFASATIEATDGLIDHVTTNTDPACDGPVMLSFTTTECGGDVTEVLVNPGANVDVSNLATLSAVGLRASPTACVYISWGSLPPATCPDLIVAGPGAFFGKPPCPPPPPAVPTNVFQCFGNGWRTLTDANGVPFRGPLQCALYVLIHSHRFGFR